MKTINIFLFLFFCSSYLYSQDTLYIYRIGSVVLKQSVSEIDSITFYKQYNVSGTVKDIDGNTYQTTVIGSQTWMTENLKTSKYRNGDTIPQITDNSIWFNSSGGRYCNYANQAINYQLYGHLYNWYAIADSRNIAPVGWHIPSDLEWQILTNYLIISGFGNNGSGDDIAKSLAAQSGWTTTTTPGAVGNQLNSNNRTRFSGLPGGGRLTNGTFSGVGNFGIFWSSTENVTTDAWVRYLSYGGDMVGRANYLKYFGLSVRCVKNCPPTVITTSVNSITINTASCSGNITIEGGNSIISRGVCWSTSPNPTIELSTKSTAGIGMGSFTASIFGLKAGTTYYARAFATNNEGAAYGNEISFVTTAPSIPAVTTTGASSITTTGALTGGNVISDGGSPIVARGVCWSKNTEPTTSDSKTIDGSGLGVYLSSIAGLSSGVNYYFRAYATNSAGTSYGAQYIISTLTAIPTLTTSAVSTLTISSLSCGGNITTNGGLSILARGVCWSVSPNPTINDTKTSDGTGSGKFYSIIANLLPVTTYYIRAYATNNLGTAYGNQISTSTSPAPPVLTTNALSVISSTVVTSGGNITSDNGSAVTVRGVCWGINHKPTINDSKTIEGSGTGKYTSLITGLNHNNTYYFRAYATNSFGTSYGGELSYNTVTSLPMVSTTPITARGISTAISGGTVTTDGGSAITERGVIWTINNIPVINGKTSDGIGSGHFTSKITDLQSGTTYHVKAYATNAVGTAYGDEFSFTTDPKFNPIFLDKAIMEVIDTYDIPSVSIAIVKTERLVYTKSYGFSNMEAQIAASDNDLYRIASVSKPITAVAILKLVENGLLRLDQTVFGDNGILGNVYGIPPAGSKKDSITVKHLLDHKSGWTNIPYDPMFLTDPLSQSEIITYMLMNRPLDSIPLGTKYVYLNFGYCVLGRIIEKVTNMTYENYVKTNILLPCGITNMQIGGNALYQRKLNEVKYYQNDYNPYKMYIDRMDANGGWIASATDLARFMVRIDRNTLKTDVVQDSLLRKMYFKADGWNFFGSLPGTAAIVCRQDDNTSIVIIANTRKDYDCINCNTIHDALFKAVKDYIAVIYNWPSYDMFNQ